MAVTANIATALAEHDGPPKSHTKPQKRLTDVDKAFALRYHAEGLTQVQIAQRLGCDQATISRWLSTCDDTTLQAGAYLRGRALAMSEKIVKRGRPSDLVKTLQGLSVLAPEQGASVTVQIGIKDSDVTFASKTSAVSQDLHSVSVETGSDNKTLR